MTLIGRLLAANLITPFDEALELRDIAALRSILKQVQVDEVSISSFIERLRHPEWSVAVEVARRFPPSDWQHATTILSEIVLPLLERPDRLLDRARVKMALIRLAAGDLNALRHWAAQAATDWRDVLVAAGLANADWQQVLAREGFAVPRGTDFKP